MANEEPSLSLVRAAQILGLSWGQAWRLLLRGDLRGAKRDGRRWYVTPSSVELLAATRSAVKPTIGERSGQPCRGRYKAFNSEDLNR